MTSLVRHITFDCADPYPLAQFWSEVTGCPVHPDDRPTDTEVLVDMPDGAAGLLFIQVPEGKTVKNRVHLDVQPQDRTRDEEVERLMAIGATLVADNRRPEGPGWVVLADPEGNEFCVEGSVAERTASS